MKTTSVAFLLSMVIAAVLTPLIRRFALAHGLVDDHRHARKIHERPIPRLGGIAIVCAYFTPLAALLVYETDLGRLFWNQGSRALGLFIGGGIIAALGLYDDLKGTGATTKFVVQFGVAGLMYYMGLRIDLIANPFGPAINLGALGLPFTLLWIVGVINAMNLIDGIDGLAGGVGLFAVGTLFVISLTRHDPLLMLFTVTLGGSIIGFLIYNFNPATIFMGDTGSMFLGFILSTTSIMTAQKSSTAVALLIPVVALGLPILDTLWALTRRAVRGHPLFRADKDHIHHRLLSIGLTQRQAALVLYAVCLLFAITAWSLTWANSAQSALLLAWLAVMAFLFMRKLGYFPFVQAAMILERRRRNSRLRAEVQELGPAIRDATAADDMWGRIKGFVDQVEAAEMALELTERRAPGERVAIRYAVERDDAGVLDVDPLVVTYPVEASGGFEDVALILTWRDGRAEVERGDEVAAEELCMHIAAALRRLSTLPAPAIPGGASPAAVEVPPAAAPPAPEAAAPRPTGSDG